MNTINNFFGPYRFLSNFWMADVEISGKVWPSVEHYYQAMKSDDEAIQEEIRKLPTPGKAKRKGSKNKDKGRLGISKKGNNA